MGVFRQFPYSNFHEMNMDEIIKIVKELVEEWATYHAEWDAWMTEINDDWSEYQRVMNEAWENMRNFINNYFDELDVQVEINNKITSMVNSGEFAAIVEPYIPPRVTEWLAANITQPVGVVIDTSLSVAGACADAKATGDAINNVLNDIIELDDNFAWMDIQWEQGGINKTTGADEVNQYFVRSDYISVGENSILVNPNSQHAITIIVYKQDGTFESATSDYTTIATQSYVNKKIRFRVRKEPIATVTPQTIGNVLIYKSFNGIVKPYVTPEMFGATTTSSVEDTDAWKALLLQDKPILCPAGKTYLIDETLEDNIGHTIIMNDSVLYGTSAIANDSFVLELDIPSAKRDMSNYQININGNQYLNGVAVKNSIGNNFDISTVNCLIGAHFTDDGDNYENTITLRARFNNFAGEYALIVEKPDNVIELVTSTNYKVCVSNTGMNYYKVIHPWLWTQASYAWSISTCFIENAQTLGAVIDFLYADTMRYGVKINNGGHVKITNYFCVLNTNAIPAATIENNKHVVYSSDGTTGVLWIHHLQTYHPNTYIALFSPYSMIQSLKIDIVDAYQLMSNSVIAGIVSECRVTSAWTCYASLPAEIKLAYTSGDILVKPMCYNAGFMRYMCMYEGVDKIFFSTNRNPSDTDWKSVTLV